MGANSKTNSKAGCTFCVKSKIIGFAGPIGVGKSSLSQAVAGKLSWKLVSSGQFLRDEASRRGLDPSSRRVLQDLGQKYIEEDRENFCRKLLEAGDWNPGDNLIVDAIRHVEVIEVLKNLTAPSELKLVHVLLDERARRARAAPLERESLDSSDSHPVESQAWDLLAKVADITIDGSDPLEDQVNRITGWVSTWQQD